MLRWTQLDTTPLQDLIRSVLNVEIKPNRVPIGEQLTIPTILGKINQVALNINHNDFKAPIFIKRVMELSSHFRLQLLLAIIDDEGTIEKTAINIRMADRKLILVIRELCQSLSLEVSKIGESINNGTFGNRNSKIFRFRIKRKGFDKLLSEINSRKEQTPFLLVKYTQ